MLYGRKAAVSLMDYFLEQRVTEVQSGGIGCWRTEALSGCVCGLEYQHSSNTERVRRLSQGHL